MYGLPVHPDLLSMALQKVHRRNRCCPTSCLTLRPNPHSAAALQCPTSRDFLPWRFSNAGRMSTWTISPCRRPKTCTKPEVAVGPRNDCSSLKSGHRPARTARPLSADSVAKLPKCMPCGQFPAKRRNKRQSRADVASESLLTSPVSSSLDDVVPHIIVRSSRLRPGEFVSSAAKRVLQQYLPTTEVAGITRSPRRR